MKPLRFAPLLSYLLLLGACTKENLDADRLIPATQEGKNTGDFLLNGLAFTPLASASSPGSRPVGAFWDHYGSGRHMQLAFSREERDSKRTRRLFNIIISNIKGPGTYPLIDYVTPNVISGSRSYAVYEIPGGFSPIYKDYLTGPASPGWVFISRYDTVAHIVSGTFEAKMHEYNGPDSVSITKGRFDFTF